MNDLLRNRVKRLEEISKTSVEDFLNTPMSPELEQKIDEIIADGESLNNSSRVPRNLQETPLDREIEQTIDDLRKGGVSEREIQRIIEEEESQSQSDLVVLMGGKRKRFRIDEGE